LKLIADLHTHSIASGHAYSTVKENAQAAARKGLELLGVTDHGPHMPDGPHLYYFYNLFALPDFLEGIRIIRGVEANIINKQGELDLKTDVLSRLELVAAGFHDVCSPYGTIKENTAAMVASMASGWVDVIVHPGNPGFQVEAESIVEAALQYGVVLEINNSSLSDKGARRGSYANCLRIAELAAEKGLTIVVGSDAHFAERIGEFDNALALVKEAGVKPAQILNVSSARVLDFLDKRQKIRRKLLGK
jgi:putative hydrolase